MWYPDWFRKQKKQSVDLMKESIISNDIPPVSEVAAFKSGRIWRYIEETLFYRIKSARDDLENQTLDIETIRVYQGRIEELRFLSSLPDFIIELSNAIKDEIEATEKAKEKQEEKSWEKK